MPTLPARVHLHDFQAFQCTNCGRCCKPWQVNIDSHQFSEIAASLAYQTRTREGYVPLENVSDGGQGLAKLGDRGDFACDFLDQHSLCSLHAELGPLGKPRGCQTYPYQVVDTPLGTYVHLSFGCPPVVAGLDTNVQVNRQELEQSLAFRLSQTPDPKFFRVQLTSDQTISWDSYLDLETRILDAYRVADPLASILSIVLDICRMAPPGPDGWSPLVQGSEDMEFPKELLAQYLGLVVGSLENESDQSALEALVVSVQEGQSVISGRFGMRLPPLGTAPPRQDWILDTYHRYFRNAVLGKSLLKTTVVARLLAVACALALAGYYARAFREARGADRIHEQDLVNAFEIVEVKVATHTRVTEPFFADLETTFIKVAQMPR